MGLESWHLSVHEKKGVGSLAGMAADFSEGPGQMCQVWPTYVPMDVE